MLLQLNGIGDQKISYKDHEKINFDSLEIYLTLAKKAISKFGPKFYSGLSAKMLKDEDAISNVANAIMMADWRWDENYESENGTKKTRYSYRNQCALWAMQTYVSKNYKHKQKNNKRKIYSLDHNDEDSTSVHELVSSCSKCPLDVIIEEEDTDILKSNIDLLINSNILTDRQKDYIKLYYYESYTFEKIGKKYGITREAVRQGLSKALDIIRGIINE